MFHNFDKRNIYYIYIYIRRERSVSSGEKIMIFSFYNLIVARYGNIYSKKKKKNLVKTHYSDDSSNTSSNRNLSSRRDEICN